MHSIVLRTLKNGLVYLGAIAFWIAFIYLMAEFWRTVVR